MVDSDYTPEQVIRLLEQDAIELIDVREPHEYAAGRIAGARHLPLGELSEQARSIARQRPVVFYCRSGVRSAMATEALGGSGWEAHNMSGGLLEWEAAGLPLDPADGRVAEP
jgi:rhodanese-related sulfurtransferase